MKIKRDIYLDRLIRREKNGLIKIVTGVRRCGKSYLLFNLFHNYLLEKGVREDHIIEIALDDRSNKELRDPDNMLKYVKERIVDKDTYYIILFWTKCSSLPSLRMCSTALCIFAMQTSM